MKRIIISAIVTTLAVITAMVISSCTKERATEIFDTSLMVVDSGMTGYIMVALSGDKITPEKSNRVVRVYTAYTNSVNAAQAIFANYLAGSTNRPAVVNALRAVAASKMEIIQAVIAAKSK